MSRFYEIEVSDRKTLQQKRNTLFCDYVDGKMSYNEWVKLDDEYANETSQAMASGTSETLVSESDHVLRGAV